jgi:cytochrome d ubiquinol oxidase subunit II
VARGATASPPPFWTVYVQPWLAPFPLAIGVLALAMFALLAAVYLTVAARDDAVREDFRRRALGAALAVLLTALAGLPLAHRHAPAVARDLTAGGMLALLAATIVAALLVIGALWARRWSLARVAAAAEVSLILWGWVGAQYPLLIPPSQSASAVAAPRVTLTLLLYALAAGGAILFPALAYLFRLFSRRVSA